MNFPYCGVRIAERFSGRFLGKFLGEFWGKSRGSVLGRFLGDLGGSAGRSCVGTTLGQTTLAIGKLITPVVGLFKPRDDRHILESQMPKGLGC
ncbi:hypothetical protein [Limnothrix redekei]|uniref:hypothetical protein n=1 Tax=Limnothrix redekei TaxID=132606 RepID=UPI00371D60C9